MDNRAQTRGQNTSQPSTPRVFLGADAGEVPQCQTEGPLGTVRARVATKTGAVEGALASGIAENEPMRHVVRDRCSRRPEDYVSEDARTRAQCVVPFRRAVGHRVGDVRSQRRHRRRLGEDAMDVVQLVHVAPIHTDDR